MPSLLKLQASWGKNMSLFHLCMTTAMHILGIYKNKQTKNGQING